MLRKIVLQIKDFSLFFMKFDILTLNYSNFLLQVNKKRPIRKNLCVIRPSQIKLISNSLVYYELFDLNIVHEMIQHYNNQIDKHEILFND